MDTWADRPLLGIDTETTGVDPATDRIVELAAVTVSPDGHVVNAWSTVIDPGITIPDDAARIHGITTARAITEGIPPHQALTELGHIIGAHTGPVVIYNARFDWPLITEEATRAGTAIPTPWLLDPLVLDKHLDPYRRGSRRLIDTAAHYQVPLTADDAHGALADATAATQIIAAMCRANPKIAATPLADLQQWQARWHDQQAISFADYRRRTSDPTFTKELGWPLPNGQAA